ncbi:MAG: DUF1684 domain-containing protein [Flavobacteriaceae bacterium]
MKAVSLLLVCLLCLLSCAQKKQPLQGETEFQKELNAEFKDASKSPLKNSDRKHFKGLDFFKFDSAYVVTAQFKRTPNERPFKMKTTTDRTPQYIKYGELDFVLKGKPLKLAIYQNLDLMAQGGYEDYLFLPFLDETNGAESYGGGRYIDARIPKGNTMVIDFNSAYNPYCAYNDKYSCPIVPRENYLRVRVEAGVKTFEKSLH